MPQVTGDAHPRLLVADLGLWPYRQAADLQKRLVGAKLAGMDEDVLLLMQHPQVITMGTSATHSDAASAKQLRREGVEVVTTRRGGRLTCHAPGQLVGYPIIALREDERDLHRYIRRIEEAVIATLYSIDIPAHSPSDATGVWVRDRKVCSIGVAVRSWVTYHGFALNVSTDMSVFQQFAPCGLDRDDMASLRELGYDCGVADLIKPVGGAFANIFARKGKFTTKRELLTVADTHKG